MRKLIAAGFLLAWACAAQVSEDVARMDRIVKHYTDAGQFMGSVLVARGGHVLFSKGYGSANVELDVPNTASTKFRLGSVTKQFTAACILLLEERGKLNVNDPVKKYMPDAPAAWDHITIHHVLTHTAGIPSFTSFPDYVPTKKTPTPVERLIGRFRDKPLEFQPGEKWAYSNSGYVLLGYLIEKISGQTYEKFVRDNIFRPLEMNDSGYDSHAAIIRNRASGYTPASGGMVNADYIDMTVPHAAGALYSTTTDLLKWEQGLFDGKLLSPDSLRKMTTPVKNGYAYGLFVQTSGRKEISHGGGIEGFNTQLAYYPDDKLVVVALGNLNGGAPGTIAKQLAAVAHGEKVVLPSERKEISVSPKVLASYAGTYELRPGFDLVVTVENGGLMTQATGQAKVPVFAESETKFFLKQVDAQIEFVKDGQNAVTHLVLTQGGREIKAKRK